LLTEFIAKLHTVLLYRLCSILWFNLHCMWSIIPLSTDRYKIWNFIYERMAPNPPLS